MAIINFTNKSTGQASTFETGSGKFLRLEDSQGTVHLFAASEITLTGTNGTVTAGQTLDLSTLLTVPPALAGKTVSWSKASGSAALTLSEHTVTAESGATASDSADFVATVAGITATVTVTAAAAAPATYDITIPTVTGATITVLVNDAAYTSGKLTHGDAVSITVAAQPNYNLTSSSVTMGGQPVTGSNGEYNISSVTGAVVISTTVELEPDEPSGPATVSFRAALTNGGTTGFAISLSDTATTMSTHNPPDNDRWVISSRSGTRGAGAPNSVHLVRTGGGGSISEIIASLNNGNYIVSAGNVSEMSYVSGDNDYVWIKAGSNFTGNTGTATDIYYTVTLTWN